MNFFWPRYLNPQPWLMTRVGRLAHWLAISVAVCSGGMIAILGIETHDPVLEPQYLLAGAALFIGIALVGRGLRYVLANE